MDTPSQPPSPAGPPSGPQRPLPPRSSGSTPTNVVAGAVARVQRPPPRKYPKPPNFFRWLVMLCLRPESWPQAVRYPTYVTLLPLLLMIVVGGLVAVAVPGVREYQALQGFAAGYDQTYPALELTSEAKLRVAGGGDIGSPLRVPAGNLVVLVDPTGKTHPEAVSWDHTLALVTDQYVYRREEKSNPFRDEEAYSRQPLSDFCDNGGPLTIPLLPRPLNGQVTTLNGAGIAAQLQARLPYFAVVGLAGAIMISLGDIIWAAVMIFIMSTVIMQVAGFQPEGQGRGAGGGKVRSLVLPRRAAVRMVAGLLVPLVLVSSILKACGTGVSDMLGSYAAPAFWMAAAMGLSVWTGVMARRMFAARLAS